MISLAKLEQKDEVFELMLTSARSQNSKQWDLDETGYPCNKFDSDIEQRTGYVYIDPETGKIISYACFDQDEPWEYEGTPWERTDLPGLYVHRLCVDPEQRGKGIAKKFMGFAEELAKEKGLQYVRLDAYSKNTSACGLYTSLGFNRVDHQVFIERMPYPCYLFEKRV